VLNICLYKPGADNNFSNDKNGMYKEVKLLEQAFIKNGCKPDIFNFDYGKNVSYHVSFVFNCMKDNFRNNFKHIAGLRQKSYKMVYILTDLRLECPEESKILFDRIATQQPGGNYNGIPELALLNYEHDFCYDKSVLFSYGGGIRERGRDFKEYLEPFISNEQAFILTKNNEFDNRLAIDEYYELLNKTKYSIVIMDGSYYENNFITWRYFENIAHNVVTFVDDKCDPSYYLLPNNHFLRVKSYNEMVEKIGFMENNEMLFSACLDFQKRKITKEKIEGRYSLRHLLKGL